MWRHGYWIGCSAKSSVDASASTTLKWFATPSVPNKPTDGTARLLANTFQPWVKTGWHWVRWEMALTGGDSDSCWASQEAVDGTSVHVQDIQFSCERVRNGNESCLIFVCIIQRLCWWCAYSCRASILVIHCCEQQGYCSDQSMC